jgi:hypothetical protein
MEDHSFRTAHVNKENGQAYYQGVFYHMNAFTKNNIKNHART